MFFERNNRMKSKAYAISKVPICDSNILKENEDEH